MPLRRPTPSVAAVLLSVLLLLVGCGASGTGVKIAQDRLERPTPSPVPDPPPVVQPVAGTVEVATDDASRNDHLGLADDGPPTEGSVQAATAAVAAALDAFFNSVQVGDPALEHIRGVWVRNVDPAAAEVLERDLANPDNPVMDANYGMRVQLEPDPTLVATDVRVRRHDDTTVKVEMVFDVSGEQPRLQLVGAAEVL